MKRKNIIFHSFSKIVLIFLLCFIWLRYFTKSLLLTTIVSAVLTFLIDIFSRMLLSKHTEKKNFKQKELHNAEMMFFSMALEDNPVSFFENIFKNFEDFCSKQKFIVFRDEKNIKTILYPLFTFENISIDQITQAIKQTKKEQADQIIIIGGNFDKECFSFIKNFNTEITLYNKFDTYEKIYKAKNAFPEIIKKTNEENNKHYPTFKELLAFAFDRKRAKGYLLSAISLLFCSLFVRITLYYSIVASLLIVFSIITLSNPFARLQEKRN